MISGMYLSMWIGALLYVATRLFMEKPRLPVLLSFLFIPTSVFLFLGWECDTVTVPHSARMLMLILIFVVIFSFFMIPPKFSRNSALLFSFALSYSVLISGSLGIRIAGVIVLLPLIFLAPKLFGKEPLSFAGKSVGYAWSLCVLSCIAAAQFHSTDGLLLLTSGIGNVGSWLILGMMVSYLSFHLSPILFGVYFLLDKSKREQIDFFTNFVGNFSDAIPIKPVVLGLGLAFFIAQSLFSPVLPFVAINLFFLIISTLQDFKAI